MEKEINSKNHDVETHPSVEKIVSVLNKFIVVGVVAVNFDSISCCSTMGCCPICSCCKYFSVSCCMDNM